MRWSFDVGEGFTVSCSPAGGIPSRYYPNKSRTPITLFNSNRIEPWQRGELHYYPHLGNWQRFHYLIKTKMSIAKNWCFTLNNWTSEEKQSIIQLIPDQIKYVMFSEEVAPTTGTPHLQGYLQLVKKNKMSAVSKLIPRARLETAKGTPSQNRSYIGKSNPVQEFGNSITTGDRSDIEALKDTVKSGVLSLKRLREEHSEVCAKYPRFVTEYISDNIPPPSLEAHPLRDWQATLNLDLNRPPEDRKVIFIVDYSGNKGKTWFAKYYCSLHENAQILDCTKKQDMAYSLNQQVRVVFVNCVRKTTEFLQYGFLEAVKDGLVFSPKYESHMKILGPCHVVVLMNQDPDMDALSKDRYDVRNI